MTIEVRELLSQVVLDTSGHASGSPVPKRLEPVVLVTPLPPKPEDFPKPVDTSSQVSTPDNTEIDDTSLEEIPSTSFPTAKTTGPTVDAPPLDMAHLWEEAKKALGDLLAIKSSIDALWQKLVSEFGMALCQNESKPLGLSRKQRPSAPILSRKPRPITQQPSGMAEAQGASQAGSIQQSHAKAIQHLDKEAIEEESKGQHNFLSTCQATLRASPPKFHGMLVASYHVLLGHAPMSHLFSISQGASPSQQGSVPGASSPPAPTVPEHSPRPKWQHHSPDPMDVLPLGKAMSKATPKGPPSLKQWEVMPLHKVLTRSHQEAFGQDSHLVRKTREEYFRNHCPNFNNENSHDLMDIFQHMIETAGLLGSAIYKIKEAWAGQDELQQANYALRTLPKGIKFFRVVSPSKSPKVMGLIGIHHLDALCCFNGLTHCPWCRKEGQNKGTIVNHLQTMHYKLGLMCEKCFGCLSITSEAIYTHCWKNCQPSGKGGPSESSLSG